VYNKVGSQASTTTTDSQVDLSWQIALQRVWENLMQGNKGIFIHDIWIAFSELQLLIWLCAIILWPCNGIRTIFVIILWPYLLIPCLSR